MKHVLLLNSIFIFCFSMTYFNQAYAQIQPNCGHDQHHYHQYKVSEVKLSKLKAAYMYLILSQHIDWEEADMPMDEYRIGFVGKNPLVKKYLEQGAANLRAQGQAVTVVCWGEDPSKMMSDYHALFIGEVDEQTYESILLQTLGTNVITFRDERPEKKRGKLAACNEVNCEQKVLTKRQKRRMRRAKKRLAKVDKSMLRNNIKATKNIPEPLIQFKVVDNKLRFKVTEKCVGAAILSDFILNKSYDK